MPDRVLGSLIMFGITVVAIAFVFAMEKITDREPCLSPRLRHYLIGALVAVSIYAAADVIPFLLYGAIIGGWFQVAKSWVLRIVLVFAMIHLVVYLRSYYASRSTRG